MIKVLTRLVVAVLITPVAFAVSASFYKNVSLIKELAGDLNYFVWGIISYGVIHLLFYKPTYLYVLGHEAVHAGVAWLFGARIKSFKASEEGGGVGTDKTNLVIELSPYFVPIYAIAITVVYFVIVSSYNINGQTFIFLIGFTLAFHIISTVEVLKIRQPDIMKSGYFFSVMLIYILNILVISALFSVLFPSFSAKAFIVDSWHIARSAYVAIFTQLFL